MNIVRRGQRSSSFNIDRYFGTAKMRTAVLLSFFYAFGMTNVVPAQGQASPAEENVVDEGLPPFIKPLAPDAPKPTPDRKDLRGTWVKLDEKPEQLRTVQGTPPPYTAAAQKMQSSRWQASQQGRPIANPAVMCRAPGVLWNLNISWFPLRVMQDERQVVFMFERFHSIWRIALNQPLPKSPKPAYMGHSVGHWEGTTLVVETAGLRDGLWLDESGTFISDQARLISRITKHPQEGKLEVLTTIDDPKNYTQPWTIRQTLRWRPDYAVMAEHDCEETSGSVEDARQYGYEVVPN